MALHCWSAAGLSSLAGSCSLDSRAVVAAVTIAVGAVDAAAAAAAGVDAVVPDKLVGSWSDPLEVDSNKAPRLTDCSTSYCRVHYC